MYSALQAFIIKHPETKNLNWYYSGEDYAGRFAPALAYYTLQFNTRYQSLEDDDSGGAGPSPINLKGIIVGSANVHPVIDAGVIIDLATSNND